MNWRERITVDPEICHGRACITGTRVLVSVILDNVAAGLSPEEIVRSYPSITWDSVRAAMCYAAELARGKVVAFPGKNAIAQPAARLAAFDDCQQSEEPQCR